jgi:uncharacterized protein (DUF849 family)
MSLREALVTGSLRKIDRLISIVIGTESFADRTNFLLKSRAQIFDELESSVLDRARKKFALLDQCVTMAQNNRVGVTERGKG